MSSPCGVAKDPETAALASSVGVNHSSRQVLNPEAGGALPTLYAATETDVAGGEYYGPAKRFESVGCPKRVRVSKRSRDQETATRLWQVSEEMTGVTYEL